MSALFVQSSLRNTKSFASKYSCLWRRGGAMWRFRNSVSLLNKGQSFKLFLEARALLHWPDRNIHWFKITDKLSPPLSSASSLSPNVCRTLWILSWGCLNCACQHCPWILFAPLALLRVRVEKSSLSWARGNEWLKAQSAFSSWVPGTFSSGGLF